MTYWAIRGISDRQAQAGYGIGARTMQAVFLPAMASVAFATGPIAGQNFGARNAQRVRDTFRHAALIGGAIMLSADLCSARSARIMLVAPFSAAIRRWSGVATEFLRIASWNFVAVGLDLLLLGHVPGAGRYPAGVAAQRRQPAFHLCGAGERGCRGKAWASLRDFWYLSVGSISMLQALVQLWAAAPAVPELRPWPISLRRPVSLINPR